MKKQTVITISVLILIAVLAMQSAEAGSSAGSPSSGGSSGTIPDTQSHNVHIGAGTPDLKCDACHGFPPVTISTQNGSGPGQYIVCEQCHGSPPNPMSPSNGNLIVIHLSRGKYCTNCHDTDNINPAHPSTKADNGTVQVIKCEICHTNPQQSTSHVNGGKYCLDCHGGSATAARTPVPTATITATATPVQPGTVAATPIQPAVADTYTEPAVTSNLEQEVRELKERINQTEQRQDQQETRISWLESALRSLNKWLKSVF